MPTEPKKNSLKSTFEIIFWIFHLIYSISPILFVTVLIFQLITTVVPFGEQKYLSYLIDSLIKAYTTKSNAWISVFIIFLSIRAIKIFMFMIQRIFQRILEFRTRNEIRKFYLNKTSTLDYQQFEDAKIASLMAKVNEEYQWRTQQIISDIFSMIVQVLSFTTVIVLLMPRYWYIGILLFLAEIPGLIHDKKWQKVDWKIFNHYSEKTRPGWDAAWQLVDKKYTAELKINHAVEWLKQKFTLIQDEFTYVRVHNRKERAPMDFVTSLISISVGGLCMLFVIKDIVNGRLSIGMFTFYFGIIRSTGDYFSGILNSYLSISEQSLHIRNFRTIMDLPQIIKSGHIKKGLLKPPTIEFKDVSFKYPNTEKYIYHHLNLTVQPGEEIAIVGPNGAGKSTLIKLLCRFYDPTEGKILINGQELKKYNTDYWYHHLSLLTQEFNTYPNLSIRENVSIGKKIDDQKIISALKKSEAYDFVKKYKDGLDTMMSQKYDGEEPSWGQWQKIAIARIFYRHTPIMVLDEPTASIDAVAESKIFSRLYKQIKNKMS